MKDPTDLTDASQPLLEPEQLKHFFINHLNRIYCVKSHVIERLPELAEQANFRDLSLAILETCGDIHNQIARMDEIFVLIDEKPDMNNCLELIVFIDNNFDAIWQQGEENLRDLSIILYMSVIESIEALSFNILQIAAGQLRHKQIQQLLRESADEAKADRALLLQITSKYLS